MKIEWHEAKNQRNVDKHQLNFADAHEVLSAPHFTCADHRKDYGEPRFIAVGTLRDRMVVVAYTMREDVYRIISMRKANAREQSTYQERLEEAR